MENAEHVYCKDRQEWREWLSKNYDQVRSVWLIYDKQASGISKLSYDEIVEEALCFGWIDSRPGKVDDTRTKIYVSKRQPKSAWSKSNKARIEKLDKLGLIESPGLKAIDLAKANGQWDSLNKSDNLEIPSEMTELFAKYPVAKLNYEKFSNSSKRIILEWIYGAKRPETRQRRIRQAVDLAQKNIRAQQQL